MCQVRGGLTAFLHAWHTVSPKVVSLKACKVRFARGQGFFFFAECEAHLRGSVAGIIVETGAGDAGYADILDEIFCEGYVAGRRSEARIVFGELEAGDVGHDVIRAARLIDCESRALQNLQESRALFCVRCG